MPTGQQVTQFAEEIFHWLFYSIWINCDNTQLKKNILNPHPSPQKIGEQCQ